MIFKQIQEIIDGSKTQTRRIVKNPEDGTFVPGGELLSYPGGIATVSRNGQGIMNSRRIKWQVGRDYAVVPKRGQPTYVLDDGTPLRIRLLGIRREPLQDINWSDALAEGIWRKEREDLIKVSPYSFASDYRYHSMLCPDGAGYENPIAAYKALWESINKRAGSRWEDNPDVWALEFERV